MAPAGVTFVSDALAVTIAARAVPGLRSELYLAGDPSDDDTGMGSVHILL